MAEGRQISMFDFDFDDDDESKPRGARPFTSWEEVARDLGRILRESKFERYLARQEAEDPDKAG